MVLIRSIWKDVDQGRVIATCTSSLVLLLLAGLELCLIYCGESARRDS